MAIERRVVIRDRKALMAMAGYDDVDLKTVLERQVLENSVQPAPVAFGRPRRIRYWPSTTQAPRPEILNSRDLPSAASAVNFAVVGVRAVVVRRERSEGPQRVVSLKQGAAGQF